jgi:hypothetical protein
VRLTKQALIFNAALAVAGCAQPESPPSVSPAVGSRLETDRDVLRATIVYLTDSRRAEERSETRRLRTAPRVLVFDAAMRVCAEGEQPRRREVPGCIGPQGVDSNTARLLRNRGEVEPGAIRVAHLSNVEYVSSADVKTIPVLAALMRQKPVGAAVIALSAPAYPTPQSAVLFCHRIWEGFGWVHLEYQRGVWGVTRLSDWRTF